MGGLTLLQKKNNQNAAQFDQPSAVKLKFLDSSAPNGS
jgi:hypothetical protein